MEWKAHLDIAALLVGIVALIVSIYAIYDARKKASEAIFLERNRVWAKALSEMMWLFIEPTAKAHSRAVADATYECFLFFEAAEPGKWTQAKVKEILENESLQSADEMVQVGYGRWKVEYSKDKVQYRLRSWKADKIQTRVRSLLGKDGRSALF